MPQAQINTTWTSDELCQRAIALVSDDDHWMVQAQSSGSMVMRRERFIAWWKWVILVILTVCTLGIALIFFPLIFIGYKQQQISISTSKSDSKTSAIITYTSGARQIVNSLIATAPK
jgi:hypothetical protein